MQQRKVLWVLPWHTFDSTKVECAIKDQISLTFPRRWSSPLIAANLILRETVPDRCKQGAIEPDVPVSPHPQAKSGKGWVGGKGQASSDRKKSYRKRGSKQETDRAEGSSRGSKEIIDGKTTNLPAFYPADGKAASWNAVARQAITPTVSSENSCSNRFKPNP